MQNSSLQAYIFQIYFRFTERFAESRRSRESTSLALSARTQLGGCCSVSRVPRGAICFTFCQSISQIVRRRWQSRLHANTWNTRTLLVKDDISKQLCVATPWAQPLFFPFAQPVKFISRLVQENCRKSNKEMISILAGSIYLFACNMENQPLPSGNNFFYFISYITALVNKQSIL